MGSPDTARVFAADSAEPIPLAAGGAERVVEVLASPA